MSLLQDRLDPTFVINILDFGRVAGRKAKIKLTCSSRLSEGTGIPQLMVLCRGVKKALKDILNQPLLGIDKCKQRSTRVLCLIYASLREPAC